MTFIGITVRKVNSSTTGSPNFPLVPGLGSVAWPEQWGGGVGGGQPACYRLTCGDGDVSFVVLPPIPFPLCVTVFSFTAALR